MTTYDRRGEGEVSGWAIGALSFAGAMMILVGIYQIIAGISAIANDSLFVKTPNYTYDLDVTAWGWIHLILGIVILLAGIALFSGQPWAGVTAMLLAILSAVANFFLIPYYPFWSLLVIALDIWILWALTRPGMVRGLE
jgi:hypothetical protein